MNLNDFGTDLEESTEFLIEKLLILHPWDEEWDFKTAIKLVPLYKEKMDLEISKNGHCSESRFDEIIRFSSILDTNKVKLLFMEQLESIPLILDDKYLKQEERIDLLIESLDNKLKKADSNLYVFFNHEE